MPATNWKWHGSPLNESVTHGRNDRWHRAESKTPGFIRNTLLHCVNSMSKQLFLKEKQCAILLLLRDGSQQWYPSKLAVHAKCTYVFAASFLSKLEKIGIVKSEKKGRQKTIVLTEPGVALSVSCDDISRKLEAFQKAATAAASSQQAAALLEKKPERSTDVV